MKYKLNPILQKLLEEKLNIHYNDYVIFLKCNMLHSSIYVLFDKNKIKFFEQEFDIEFVKVKGHSGNKWNEKCDELANSAMDGF